VRTSLNWSVELDLLGSCLEALGLTPYDVGGRGAVNRRFAATTRSRAAGVADANPNHSSRSVTAGSTCVARRAGA